MKITKRIFGTMPDGTQVFCWRMENAHGLYGELLDYGAALPNPPKPTSICV